MTLQYGGMFEQGNMRYLLSSGNVEDNFNTWTKVWEKPITDNLWSDGYMDLLIDDKSDVLYLSWKDKTYSKNRFGAYNLADFSAIFESPADEYYTNTAAFGSLKEFLTFGYVETNYGGMSRSIQTYLVLQRADYHTHEVWRSGVKLWSRDYRLDSDMLNDNSWCGYGGMSITGKYIILQIEDLTPSPDVFYLMLYKGSYVEP